MPPCKVEHDQMETCHIVFINKSYNITRGHLSKSLLGGYGKARRSVMVSYNLIHSWEV